MDAAPINPADVKTIFCGIERDALRGGQERGVPFVRGWVPQQLRQAFANRIDKDIPLGNEGTGLVVATGNSNKARALLGERVAIATSGTFGDICAVEIDDCIVLPAAARPESAASAWINPMTALAIIETMRKDGHRALALTAAASNLGKMLNRLCLEDSIPLVNIVRSEEGASALRAIGARYICNSSTDEFEEHLVEAVAQTGATLAFDATGGGALAGKILLAMERAATRHAQDTSRYGSAIYKQLYFFGGLDPSPVIFKRSFGMAWGMGGWLLQTALSNMSPTTVSAMKARVHDGLESVFVSDYERVLGLEEMLLPSNFALYAKFGTGGKVLIKI